MKNSITQVWATSPYPPSFNGDGHFYFATIESSGVIIALALLVWCKYVKQLFADKSAKWNSAVTSFRAILILLSTNAIMAKLPDWLYLITFGSVDPYWSQILLSSRRVVDSLTQFSWMAMATLIIASGPQIVYALKHPMITGSFNLQAQKGPLKEISFFIVIVTLFSALAAVAKHYEFILTAH